MLKSLLGKEITFAKVKTEREATQVKPESILNLQQAKEIIWLLSERGNEVAKQLAKALILEAFERRFNNAFGVKCTEEEHNFKLKVRMFGKIARRSFTDAIQDWLIRHNYDPKGNYAKFQIYAKVSDMVNVAVFGKVAKELREELRLNAMQLIRDNVESPELQLIQKIEEYAKLMVDKRDMHPVDALKESLAMYC